jgi:hypothetical protein
MLTLGKIFGLLLFVVFLGYLTFLLVLGAIGLALYSYETFKISIYILIGLGVASIGGGWLARILQTVPLAAIAPGMVSLAASLGIVTLALTATTAFLSGTEKQLLYAVIAIAFTLLALAMAGFSGWRSLLQIKTWLN